MGRKIFNIISFILLVGFAAAFIFPIAVILINSFKAKFSINSSPFSLPMGDEFVGLSNYETGIKSTGFPPAFGWSLFITVFSVALIIICTSMCAWYIVRVKNLFTGALYYALVFSMIVPFQMVMFTMSKTANFLHLDNPLGIIFIYLGFGAGLSVFMFTGFIKTVPLGIEEAATIDGCSPIQTFALIVFPILKPTAVTVAILNTMWIWNDYLLPYLVIGSDYKTIPVAVQYLKGGYGSVDMGAMMAMLVLSVIPVIVFYLSGQKYIIKGVAAGAVKG
ncbi:MAG: carbohydrate ABC transporter permease [Acutalibacteraceae bacterium]|nr:carbohydrate ABC transporter permease [Clostridia bacterium]MEE1330387.1 carbohydrate ABC transporter permease [Acutalibacteraceae bacterium]